MMATPQGQSRRITSWSQFQEKDRTSLLQDRRQNEVQTVGVLFLKNSISGSRRTALDAHFAWGIAC